jgi:hypothetical protein
MQAQVHNDVCFASLGPGVGVGGVLTESFHARPNSFSVFFALVFTASSLREMRKTKARNTA